jgi:hypothetical protein
MIIISELRELLYTSYYVGTKIRLKRSARDFSWLPKMGTRWDGEIPKGDPYRCIYFTIAWLYVEIGFRRLPIKSTI